MSNPIRILHVVSELNQGGIENFIMNIYRSIDKNKVQFDFIVHHTAKGVFEDEIELLGGKVFHFSFLDDKNYFKYKRDLKKFFKENDEYNIIHGHLASLGFIYLKYAKKAGIKNRIAHSHGTATPKSLKGFIKSITFKYFGKYSTIRFACSTEAGKYMFNTNDDFTFIPNAIDFNRFKYNIDVRNNIRKKYKIDNNCVIGHVGRFTIEKNHAFILEILSEIKKTNENIKLLLVGDGPLRNTIQMKVEELGLTENVIFTGNIKNVQDMYNAMDLFILPSLFEGLPVTGIESQVSGLPSIFSNNVTREVKISSLADFLEIDDYKVWAEKLINTKINKNREESVITNNNFDVSNLANYLEKYYTNLK